MLNKTERQLRATVKGLVQAAAADRPGAEWIDREIRKAGYTPRKDIILKRDVIRFAKDLRRAMERSASALPPEHREAFEDRLRREIDQVEEKHEMDHRDGRRDPAGGGLD